MTPKLDFRRSASGATNFVNAKINFVSVLNGANSVWKNATNVC